MAGIERPLLQMASNDDFVARRAAETAAAQAAQAAQTPVLTGLAAHLRTKWDMARNARMMVEDRMRRNLRMRRGEYESDKLAAIRTDTGGSEIYMMLPSVKCRAAASWLRDAIMGQGSEKPWTSGPTPEPDLPGDVEASLMQAIGMEVGQMAAAGTMPPPELVTERINAARDALAQRLKEKARLESLRTESKLEDALLEGGFLNALDEAIDDLVTYPAAIIKGPVARMEPVLEWVREGAQWRPQVTQKIRKTYHRVNPFNFYPMGWMANVQDGDVFELHELTPSALHAMIGSPGYNEDAIREVLKACANGTAYTDWAGVTRNTDREINQPGSAWAASDRPVQAIEFWGQVPGSALVAWGMAADQVPDLEQQYSTNCWLIANHVIKATINIDPLGDKPYSKMSYEEIPGAFWGNAVPDLIRDLTDACNAAARSLINNMALASGPMVWMNIDRMPQGTNVTKLHPWKLFQGTSDPMGSTAPPIEFFQPNAQADQLLRVFEYFSNLADEYSGIPKYLTGNANIGGAGRTSSGLSMLMGNATKLMKQVLSGVDRVFESVLQRTHTFMLRYEPEADLRGDVRIIARGANSVSARETMQLRRNEFLAMTANPIDVQIMGPGRAYLLHEQARALGLDATRVVPNVEHGGAAAGMPPTPQPGQPGQPGAGMVPGQQGQPGVGGPANGPARPEGALMDRMSV